ncbi:HK97 family phage prohead protease [Nocardia cyriacigeorgica]|uniref:HK97 family phage prohead protease n=1 Tax=Nocardia cyriacigeorgica TaxID=135487 RepID=UPI0013B9F3AA|nr:HK97 family phage prohead protease [Nocardia cyriacigeorgica]NEW49953.1 HK97 family phage prohead protease [Nocardia cyriacigeorgica]
MSRELIREWEFRQSSDSGDGRTLEGYAAVFDQRTTIRDYSGEFTESIARGAFRKTLTERMPALQWNHGSDPAVGEVPIGKFVALHEDTHGLHVTGRVFANQAAERVREAIAEEAVTGMSFRFRVLRDSWVDERGKTIAGEHVQRALHAGKQLHRTLREVQLMEAGPVLSPAYAGTSVSVRSADGGAACPHLLSAAQARRMLDLLKEL